MNPPPGEPAACTRTDPVLARFLDGEPVLAPSDDDLDRHLFDCPACAAALQRARRLDAVLAQHSRIEVSDALADRLLRPALAPARSRRRPVRGRLAAAALVLAGVAVGYGLSRASAVRPADRQPAPLAGGLPATRIDLPPPAPRGTGTRPRRSRRTPWPPATVLASADLADRLLPGVVLTRLLAAWAQPGGSLPTWPGLQRLGRLTSDAARIAAGQALLRSRERGAQRALSAFLVSAPDGPVLAALLARAREDAELTRRLARRLAADVVQAADVRLAARLGQPPLDRELVRCLRRTPELIDSAARVVTGLAHRPGRVALLLDLWAVAPARPGSDGGPATWFRSLPPAATDELVAAIETTKRADRRLQGLRALAWRRDPAAVGCLLAQVDDNHHETALAAGHALSQLAGPAVAVAVQDALRRSHRPQVLLAALCGVDADLARRRLRWSALSPEEAAFLASGEFTPDQFAIACRLCRRRSLAQ